MKKAIVTGANGFVGSALVRELLSRGVEVVALDRAGCSQNLPEGVTFLPCELDDILSIEKHPAVQGSDIFFHLAWAGVSGENRSSVKVQLNNVQWTVDCLLAAKQIGCRRFVCSGSIMEDEVLAACSVQGNQPAMGYIYGSSKLAAHTICKSVAANIGMELIWAKLTNAYGPGENSPRLINSTIRKIIRNQPLNFTSGLQNYDFVYITDVTRAFYLIGEKGQPFYDYLIGSANPKPLWEFLFEMKQTLAPTCSFNLGSIPYTGVNMPLSTFDSTQIRKDTGFTAVVPFSEGIMKTYQWVLEQEKGVKK